MIISSIIKGENTCCEIFQLVEIAIAKLNSNNKKTKGSLLKYSDQQIIAFMSY